MNDTIDADVARYATAVRAAFADLPGPERELLLEDLEDHLQEVAAEGGGPLSERLGAPEAYAAELRASAGLPAPGAPPGRRRRATLRESRPARRLERRWRRALAHPAGGAIVGFLPELRPAWWVARGYLAVQAASVALSLLFAGDGLRFPVPELFGSQVLGLLAVAAAVAGSVALGRRTVAGGRRARGLLVAGNTALALFAVLLLMDLGASRDAADAGWDQAQYVGGYPGSDRTMGLRGDGREISNIYPFDQQGRPLRDVYLVDQYGQPVVTSHLDDPDVEPRLPVDLDGNAVLNRYPQAQDRVDPATGRRTPTTAPTFRPPPGPVRTP